MTAILSHSGRQLRMRTSPLHRALRSPALRRKSSGRPVDTGVFAEHLRAGEPPDAGATATVDPPSTLLALLDIQEADGDGRTAHRRAALCRGDALLGRLESLRTEILYGRVAPQRLQALAQALREERAASGDDEIEAVLAEIDLRVEVEIAKLAVFRHPPGGGR